jgi:hypothetical protein
MKKLDKNDKRMPSITLGMDLFSLTVSAIHNSITFFEFFRGIESQEFYMTCFECRRSKQMHNFFFLEAILIYMRNDTEARTTIYRGFRRATKVKTTGDWVPDPAVHESAMVLTVGAYILGKVLINLL